jgi:hypothetical protein
MYLSPAISYCPHGADRYHYNVGVYTDRHALSLALGILLLVEQGMTSLL